MMELLKDTNIDFVSHRKKAFILSTILVIMGLFAFVMISLGKANISVDFTGGTNLHIRFKEKVDIGDLRKTFTDGGISDVQIQEVGGTNDFLIKTKLSDTQQTMAQEKVTSILSKDFSDDKYDILGSNMVGPGVGRDLKKYAIIAVCLALLGVIIYIAWRFTLLSGIAATVATFHDVVVTLGIFYILNKEFNLLIITALLTIAGYSLQDTVVIFDRIRENSGKMKSRAEYGNIINRSINEVLSRTVITGITTLLALVSLMVFGGDVLFDFAFALVIGIVIGTYSSIFIASPLMFVWKKQVR